MSFDKFDPLTAKQAQNSEAALHSIRREIQNILDSYFNWFDPFSEIIQNALDAVDLRRRLNEKGYSPEIHIKIDIKNNFLSVCENGIGLEEEQFKKFLAPSFSFKGKNSRGHKGVGATYLAYGFNYIQVATKHPDFAGTGVMTDARKWLWDETSIETENPKISADRKKPPNELFSKIKRGTCVTVKFDTYSKPSDLDWLKAKSAGQWEKLLRIKTGLGAIQYDDKIKCVIEVISKSGEESKVELKKPSYLWPDTLVKKAVNLTKLKEKEAELFKKKGSDFRMPSKFRNLEAIFDRMNSDEILEGFDLNTEEKEVIRDFEANIYFCYFYTSKVFAKFNENLKIRAGQNILKSGIQLAANNMPQGEIGIINLTRNIGRQNHMHVVCHFSNARSDLGRKGFQEELVELVDKISTSLITKKVAPFAKYLKATSGAPVSLKQKQKVDDWKKEFEEHENENPLVIKSKLFFQPKKSVSVSSLPTREQDVIALFNQFLAGGVIRGIDILSTNERFIYDSMFRVVSSKDEDTYLYHKKKNPLGVEPDKFTPSFRSSPKILEYKFSLNALLEDISNGTKNTNEVDLVVAWETGSDFESHYRIDSALDPENLSIRNYHGVTHTATSMSSGQHEFDLIILSELVDYLNNQKKTIKKQREKYED